MSNFWLVQHKQKWSAQCKELALNEGAWLALFLPPSYFLEYRHNDELKQPFWTKNENKPLKRAEWTIRKKVKSLSRFRLFATPWTVAYQAHPSVGFSSIGVGCHFLLQRIFPTQETNLGLPHWRQTLYRLSHLISEWLWSFPISLGCQHFTWRRGKYTSILFKSLLLSVFCTFSQAFSFSLKKLSLFVPEQK